MTVYAVALITIEDRITYKRYQRNFGAVFDKFQGKVLAMRDKPRVVEGEWVGDKVIIMAFPCCLSTDIRGPDANMVLNGGRWRASLDPTRPTPP
jgi:hypothetical protein